MAKAHVIITAIQTQGLSYRQVAKRYGVSKSWAHKIHQRFLRDGPEALEPRSRKPSHSPRATPPETCERVLQLRDELTTAGLDAGAHTLVEHLARERITLSPSTVWRIMKRADIITPQPQKRPRSSYLRFNAEQPNSMWQSDFTHWNQPGLNTEIIGWIDDHSRFLLHLSAHRRVTGKTVSDTFSHAAHEHGWPASTLTDNGMVYTTRHAAGARGLGHDNAFETLLKLEGIIQKNGRPYKPTTQGKIERLWQTLKLYLNAQPQVHTLAQLQQQLDDFRHYYNHIRPHRSIGRNTPAAAYALIPKASPSSPTESTWKVLYSKVNEGRITIRFGNKMLHLGVGREHERNEVIALLKDHDVTIIDPQGTVLGEYLIDPEKNYQAKKKNT